MAGEAHKIPPVAKQIRKRRVISFTWPTCESSAGDGGKIKDDRALATREARVRGKKKVKKLRASLLRLRIAANARRARLHKTLPT